MVDGKLSQWAYLSSVDTCYQRYKEKWGNKYPTLDAITVDHFDYFAFHSPYNKLVQKGFARFLYVDLMTLKADATATEAATVGAGDGSDEMFKDVVSFKSMPVQDTYESRELEAAFRSLSNSRSDKEHLSLYLYPSLYRSRSLSLSLTLILSQIKFSYSDLFQRLCLRVKSIRT